MKLTHTQSQVIITKELGELPQSDLSITVNYNPEERTVEEIVSVCVFNWKTLETTDITHIMEERFGDSLETMIDGIDWYAEYRSVKDGPEPEPDFLAHASNDCL
jgi:hypothetical protein